MALEDDEDMVDEVVEKKKSGIVKILMISLLVIFLIALSIGATLYMTGSLDRLKGDSQEVSGESTGDGKAATKKENFYFAFDPPFVVNFSDGEQIRYLQVSIEVMSYSEAVIEDVKKHTPVIRNNLIFMLSNLNYETLSSVAGKKKLRSEALAEIRNILKEKTGKPGVEEVYFTGFVMQ